MAASKSCPMQQGMGNIQVEAPEQPQSPFILMVFGWLVGKGLKSDVIYEVLDLVDRGVE